MSDWQTAKELFAGCVGGIVQVLVGQAMRRGSTTIQPFDTVKVRLQTQPREAPLYTGVVDCASKTLRNEGVLGFYKGTLTPLVGIGACVSIQFGALEAMKRLLSGGNANGSQNLSLAQLYIAGAASGVANSVLSGPIEHIRTRLQVQSSANRLYSGPVDFISKVSKQYGYSALLKGQAITVLREFHGYGIYFAVYEYMMQRTMAANNIKRSQVPSWKQLIYGALSGYTLWIFIYPIDVVKSKLQTDTFDKATQKYSGAIDCFRKTMAAEGFAGLYRGFWACMLRAGPANAATFAAYEMTMNFIGR
ncbi:Mitochondrial carrier protein ymc2 [Polyrhizophydium stewartii]|uniref:Mitochondrial carrier protein ymc2 n=1 Tax=Polyrhizophydium stewartii TaxID=2732419 RepID=A0ABR4NHV5_9FUNG